MRRRYITGERVNRLTFVSPAFPGRNELWVVRCDCGHVQISVARSVVNGRIQSCGCLNDELRLQRNTKHGCAGRGTKTPEYFIWRQMIQRCENPNDKSYRWYGGRGISVCQKWRASFLSFLADVGLRPGQDLTIDRVDNDGNYEPGNVRWATWQEQASNKRKRAA
jgi:hypothetical protein